MKLRTGWKLPLVGIQCECPLVLNESRLICRTIIGIIAVTEKVALEAEREQTSMFFSQLFEKQLGRQRAMLDAFVVSCPFPK